MVVGFVLSTQNIVKYFKFGGNTGEIRRQFQKSGMGGRELFGKYSGPWRAVSSAKQ